MLYNTKKNQINGTAFCLECKYFVNKKCEGLGKICFEYDPKTRIMIDPVTKLPIKPKRGQQQCH